MSYMNQNLWTKLATTNLVCPDDESVINDIRSRSPSPMRLAKLEILIEFDTLCFDEKKNDRLSVSSRSRFASYARPLKSQIKIKTNFFDMAESPQFFREKSKNKLIHQK